MLVDKEEGLKLSYGSESLYQKIIAAYLEESDGYLERLEAFLAEKNWREYTVIAHAIKSNSKQIGANALFEEALSMEMAGKSEDEAFIGEHHATFIEHYKEVLDELKKGE